MISEVIGTWAPLGKGTQGAKAGIEVPVLELILPVLLWCMNGAGAG